MTTTERLDCQRFLIVNSWYFFSLSIMDKSLIFEWQRQPTLSYNHFLIFLFVIDDGEIFNIWITIKWQRWPTLPYHHFLIFLLVVDDGEIFGLEVIQCSMVSHLSSHIIPGFLLPLIALDSSQTSQLHHLYPQVTLLIQQPLLLGDALFNFDLFNGCEWVLQWKRTGRHVQFALIILNQMIFMRKIINWSVVITKTKKQASSMV